MYLNNPAIILGADSEEVDITEIVSSATLTFSRPNVSGQNTFGVRGQRRRVKGLWDGSLTLTFHQGWESDGFSQQVYAWLAGDDTVPFRLRAIDDDISEDNPEFQGALSVSEFPVQDGDPESLAAASVTWETDGVPVMVTEESS